MFDLQETRVEDYTDRIPTTIDYREDPEETVQVKLTIRGVWHRKAIGGASTACGRPLGGYAVRDETYAGDLCRDGCFSAFELAKNELSDTTPDLER